MSEMIGLHEPWTTEKSFRDLYIVDARNNPIALVLPTVDGGIDKEVIGATMSATVDLRNALHRLLSLYTDGRTPSECCTCLRAPMTGERHDPDNPCEVCKAVAALAKANGKADNQ